MAHLFGLVVSFAFVLLCEERVGRLADLLSLLAALPGPVVALVFDLIDEWGAL